MKMGWRKLLFLAPDFYVHTRSRGVKRQGGQLTAVDSFVIGSARSSGHTWPPGRRPGFCTYSGWDVSVSFMQKKSLNNVHPELLLLIKAILVLSLGDQHRKTHKTLSSSLGSLIRSHTQGPCCVTSKRSFPPRHEQNYTQGICTGSVLVPVGGFHHPKMSNNEEMKTIGSSSSFPFLTLADATSFVFSSFLRNRSPVEK